MSNIPTQLENEKGLHQRYVIQKIVKESFSKKGGSYGKRTEDADILKVVPVDKDAEYFVMRLDTGGKDPFHITACRIGIHAYADAIKDHLPDLSCDLKKRYPLLTPTKAVII